MIPAHVRIFVSTAPVDMRRGFDGLALAVRERLDQDPRAGGLFVFVNRRANRCKVLWFDRTGACLLYKRLHGALFRLPTGEGASAVRIEAAALATLLDGVPVPPRREGARGARESGGEATAR
jgi:transposase